MINTQILNDALMAVAFVIGVAFALTVAMVTVSALWQRRAPRTRLRAVEQHLAAGTQEAIPANTRGSGRPVRRARRSSERRRCGRNRGAPGVRRSAAAPRLPPRATRP